MARFSGPVGFAESVELRPGVWDDVISERDYKGSVVRNARRLQAGEGLNSNVVVEDQISIVGDNFAIDHFMGIKYVGWMGQLWTVSNTEVQRPRLILSLGSVYNGPTP